MVQDFMFATLEVINLIIQMFYNRDDLISFSGRNYPVWTNPQFACSMETIYIYLHRKLVELSGKMIY
jgi:hypothetical protein